MNKKRKKKQKHIRTAENAMKKLGIKPRNFKMIVETDDPEERKAFQDAAVESWKRDED